MTCPYSESGEWLAEHIRDEGFSPHEVRMAACMDISVVIRKDELTAESRLSLVRELLDVVEGITDA